mgnify:CR=1 FL=1
MYECECFYNLEQLLLRTFVFNVEKNQIGDEGFQYFCESLDKVFKNLKALGLRENGLTTKSVKNFIRNPSAFKTLHTLGLSKNTFNADMNLIDQEAIDLLIEANLMMPNLENLWLVGNKLRNSDLEKFNAKYDSIRIK